MTTLKQACENGDFEEFIKEREGVEADGKVFKDILNRVEKGAPNNT